MFGEYENQKKKKKKKKKSSTQIPCWKNNESTAMTFGVNHV